MEWSKEERVVLDELNKMPTFPLSSDKKYEMFQQVKKGERQMRQRRTRKMVIGSVAGIAAVVLLTFGVWKQGLVSDYLQDRYVSSQGQSQKVGVAFLYDVQLASGEKWNDEQKAAVSSLLQRRLTTMGVVDAKVTVSSKNQVLVEVPGDWRAEQKAQFKQALAQPPKLELRDADGKVLASGSNLIAKAGVQLEPMNEQHWMISLTFADPEMFKTITEQNFGKQVSMWLDGVMLNNPTVQAVITNGQTVVGMDQDKEKLQEVANAMNAMSFAFTLQEHVAQ